MSPLPPALINDLDRNALRVLGGCEITPDDNLPGYASIALIGPSEPDFWPHFQSSTEAKDRAPDPLDRWSRRVLTDIAARHNAHPLFPFGGAPYHPFFTWAQRSGRFWASPIQFLVHDSSGLFASFRGALALTDTVNFPTGIRPCETCTDQPCRSACPVDAFDHGYDVTACKAHLNIPQGADCMTKGCRARRACPVGKGLRLPAQAAFHMDAFHMDAFR